MRLHLLHDWETVKDTVKYQYQECRICEKRRLVTMSVSDYQPIDYDWLKHKKDKIGSV